MGLYYFENKSCMRSSKMLYYHLNRVIRGDVKMKCSKKSITSYPKKFNFLWISYSHEKKNEKIMEYDVKNNPLTNNKRSN